MKSVRTIIFSALALYAVALGVAWNVCTQKARRHVDQVLIRAEKVYLGNVNDSVDSVLLHVGVASARRLGTAHAVSTDEMQALADELFIDELNVVDTNGVCLGSTNPGDVGFDYHTHPDTIDFLDVLDKDPYFKSQDFRFSTSSTNDYRKYMAVAFDDDSGFMEIGFNFSRLAPIIDLFDVKSIAGWKIGSSGHYDLLDPPRKDLACVFPPGTPDGVVIQTTENGIPVYCRAFTIADHRFLAVLNKRESYSQRDLDFTLLAPALAIVVLFLAFFLRSISKAGESEARRRASEDAARAADLAMARDVQLSALPSDESFRRDSFSFSFKAVSKPAREVGGDFYDFFQIDSKHMAFVIADVSGKGVPAAMFMMKAKNEIKNALLAGGSLVEAVRAANDRICSNNEAELFVTAWIGVLNTVSGKMEYVNAGHNRPFIRRADGSVEKIMPKGGVFLGMFPGANYRSAMLKFSPDDALYLYTDGVSEAMNAERQPFGESRIVSNLGKAEESMPEAVIASVGYDLRAHVAGADQSDDMTALCMVWHGVPPCRMKEFPAAEASFGPAMDWLRGELSVKDSKAKARLLNAADEIMVNIVTHSNAKTFTMSVESVPGRTRLTFRDDGAPYDPLGHHDPSPQEVAAEEPVGGLGILMTRHLVDGMFYRRDDDRNELVLVKFG